LSPAAIKIEIRICLKFIQITISHDIVPKFGHMRKLGHGDMLRLMKFKRCVWAIVSILTEDIL
jgi:hypothetical protein